MEQTLTSHDFQRYAQQIKLTEIGVTGQLQLKSASVLCVGAGGLACPALLYLASAGIGRIGIVDEDTVALSNLHRQMLYHPHHIGQAKVQCARAELQSRFPHQQIDIHETRLQSDNAVSLLCHYDVIVDCTDNFATHFLLNDVCSAQRKSLVTASVSAFTGQCMTVHAQHGPCLRCLFPAPPTTKIATCEEGGVLGVVPGLLGVIQATEAIKLILNRGAVLSGRVLVVDLLQMTFREFQLAQNSDCETCKQYRIIPKNYKRESIVRSENEMNQWIITPQALQAKLANQDDIELIDVRTLDKHIAFNIGGKHIPMEELPDRLQEVDPDKLIITYCTSGGRSMRALQYLVSVGYETVKSLDGGMTAWQALANTPE